MSSRGVVSGNVIWGGGCYKETRKGKAERKREYKGKLKFKGQNKGTVGKYLLTACGGMA